MEAQIITSSKQQKKIINQRKQQKRQKEETKQKIEQERKQYNIDKFGGLVQRFLKKQNIEESKQQIADNFRQEQLSKKLLEILRSNADLNQKREAFNILKSGIKDEKMLKDLIIKVKIDNENKDQLLKHLLKKYKIQPSKLLNEIVEQKIEQKPIVNTKSKTSKKTGLSYTNLQQ